MTEFEILSVPIFFVLGLGVTKILGAAGSTRLKRKRRPRRGRVRQLPTAPGPAADSGARPGSPRGGPVSAAGGKIFGFLDFL